MKSFIVIIIILLSSCMNTKKIDSTPIENFEVNKYLGKWYEIARTNNSFEKGCTNVTADYSLRNDGGLNVVNRCIANGKEKISNGRAYFKNGQNKAALKVTFFWPFYGNYNVVYIDKNYRYAIVDGGTDEYLWILAREKTIDNKTLEMLIKQIVRYGFDPQTLIYT